MKVTSSILLGALMIGALVSTDRSGEAGIYCRGVQTIAKDSDKVAYLRQWIEDGIANAKTRTTLGPTGYGTGKDFKPVQLDFEHLGIVGPGEVWVRLYPLDRAPGEVKSVSVSKGRDTIFIRMIGASDSGLPRNVEEGLEFATGDVAIVCG